MRSHSRNTTRKAREIGADLILRPAVCILGCALADPGVKERLASLGADIVASSPEQTAAMVKADLAKYTGVAKAAGIHVD